MPIGEARRASFTSVCERPIRWQKLIERNSFPTTFPKHDGDDIKMAHSATRLVLACMVYAGSPRPSVFIN